MLERYKIIPYLNGTNVTITGELLAEHIFDEWGYSASLEDLKDFLNKIDVPEEYFNVRTVCNKIGGYDDGGYNAEGYNVQVIGDRLETKDEKTKRLAQQDKYKEHKRERDLQHLEELAKRCDATIIFKEN